MSWLTRLFTGQTQNVKTESETESTISEDLFIEKLEENKNTDTFTRTSLHGEGIYRVYQYLRMDYEEQGYNDSLTNADSSYMQSNLDLIKNDLETLIQEVQTEYEDYKKRLNFHIDTRTRAGLMDIVEELNSEMARVNDHLDKINKIQDGSQNDNGLAVRAFLSYKRGFAKGMAAISHNQINNRR